MNMSAPTSMACPVSAKRTLATSLAIAIIVLALFLYGCASSPTESESQLDIPDGNYSVTLELEGGSGRANVTSPCNVSVENGQATATIEWSSSNYDKMGVDGKEYKPINSDGNSQFQIPIPNLDCDLTVSAETTAMSQPHTIDYTLHFTSDDEAPSYEEEQNEAAASSTTIIEDFHDTNIDCDLGEPESIPLSYAKEFTIDKYPDGYALICMADGSRYLIIPESKEIPDGLASNVAPIQLPIENGYIAASSMLCLVDSLGSIDSFTLCSIKESDCSVENFSQAIRSGKVAFGGKYNAPDYESITASKCQFALESTMINHVPKVKRQLEDLGITVMTELSSYETDPRSRLEWIKMMGLILDKESEAQEIFDQQIEQIEGIQSAEATGKKVAFFYINSNGSAVVRKSGDYIPAMISMAGGEYVFSDIGDDTATSTATIDMESFFSQAKDSDILIYNGTIDNSVESINDLISKNNMLSQFKAVEEGNVWTTDQDMYQQMVNTGDIIVDMHSVFTGNAENLTYLKKLS